MNQDLVAEILALPASERMLLVEAIWDSIAAVPEALELTQWQKDELDRSLAEFEADPDSGATLEEVFRSNLHLEFITGLRRHIWHARENVVYLLPVYPRGA